MSGLLWSVIEVLIKRVLDLLVRLVLARLLFPADFGVVGMATVFYAFMQAVNEAGMGMALIQRKEEELTESHYHTAFWSNFIWSIILYVLFAFAVGPFAAYFYKEPILTKIMPILGLSFLFSSLNTVHKAQLVKEMKFKKIAFINNLSSTIAGIVSVGLAYLDFGVWALVIYNVLGVAISAPLYFQATKWLPKFNWNKQAFQDIFGFGVYTTGTKIVSSISANVDYLIIGKLVSASALGAYSLAYMLTNMVKTQIESMLNRVLFPFYSSIQHDLEKIKEYYLKIIKYYAAMIYPLMVALILIPKSIIYTFFGEKWSETILPTQILAVAVVINVICSGYNLLFRSIGKPRLEMNLQFFLSLVIYVPAILIGVYFNGIVGVSYSILISTIIRVIIIQIIIYRFFGIRVIEILNAIKEPGFAFLLSMVLGYIYLYFAPENNYLTIGVITCIIIISNLFFMKREIRILKDRFLKRKGNK